MRRLEPTATDAVIMARARVRSFVVVTHDLDFSALLSSAVIALAFSKMDLARA